VSARLRLAWKSDSSERHRCFQAHIRRTPPCSSGGVADQCCGRPFREVFIVIALTSEGLVQTRGFSSGVSTLVLALSEGTLAGVYQEYQSLHKAEYPSIFGHHPHGGCLPALL